MFVRTLPCFAQSLQKSPDRTRTGYDAKFTLCLSLPCPCSSYRPRIRPCIGRFPGVLPGVLPGLMPCQWPGRSQVLVPQDADNRQGSAVLQRQCGPGSVQFWMVSRMAPGKDAGEGRVPSGSNTSPLSQALQENRHMRLHAQRSGGHRELWLWRNDTATAWAVMYTGAHKAENSRTTITFTMRIAACRTVPQQLLGHTLFCLICVFIYSRHTLYNIKYNWKVYTFCSLKSQTKFTDSFSSLYDTSPLADLAPMPCPSPACRQRFRHIFGHS